MYYVMLKSTIYFLLLSKRIECSCKMNLTVFYQGSTQLASTKNFVLQNAEYIICLNNLINHITYYLLIILIHEILKKKCISRMKMFFSNIFYKYLVI